MQDTLEDVSENVSYTIDGNTVTFTYNDADTSPLSYTVQVKDNSASGNPHANGRTITYDFGDGSIVSELYTGNYSITGGASVSSSDALVTLTGNNRIRYNGAHGIMIGNGDQVSVKVAGNAEIVMELCAYTADGSMLNADVTDWFAIKAGVKYIQKVDDRDCGAPSLGNFSIVPSTFVAKQSDGSWGTVNGGKRASTEFINYNPLRALSKGDWSQTKSENTMYDLGFDIKPVKGLVISGQGTFRGTEYKNKSYTALQNNVVDFLSGDEISGTGNTVNKMSMDWQSSSTMLYTATARYDWSKDIHNLSVLLGTSYEHYKFQQV